MTPNLTKTLSSDNFRAIHSDLADFLLNIKFGEFKVVVKKKKNGGKAYFIHNMNTKMIEIK